jgi:hypothetical protein
MNGYFVSYDGKCFMKYSLGSAIHTAKEKSKEHGEAEVIIEKPYFYHGYRFWLRSEKRYFRDGTLDHVEDLNVLYCAANNKYLPIDEWKKEQNKFYGWIGE